MGDGRMPVRLVSVDRASQGAIPVYESPYTGSVPVVQRQDNPGAVPVYVGPRGMGMPVNFGSAVPDIPAPPPDPPPTLLSATIDATGMTLTLVFSETVLGDAGFDLNAGLASGSVSLNEGIGTNTYQYLIVDGPVAEGQVCTLDYTPGDIEDPAGNPMAAFTDFPVTNNAGATNFRVTSTGDSRTTSGGDSRITS